jgi:multiple sugar transport system ATP-binding protein
MAVVTLKGLTKTFEGSGEPAVQDVSFQVEDGEFMVLLGPSGCGKSTILRMIAGLETISSGELSIDGRLMNHVPAKDRDIAMVFQSYALYPHMKVRDNLAFGLKRRGIPKEEVRRRVAQAAEALGLTPFLDRRPHALSGGQRQRVAVGRAIVRDPKVFLFDEPLSNLDAALRVSTRNELVHLRDPRSGGSHDHGQPHLHHQPGATGSDRPSHGRLPVARQHLCRRFSRQPAHESVAGPA